MIQCVHDHKQQPRDGGVEDAPKERSESPRTNLEIEHQSNVVGRGLQIDDVEQSGTLRKKESTRADAQAHTHTHKHTHTHTHTHTLTHSLTLKQTHTREREQVYRSASP